MTRDPLDDWIDTEKYPAATQRCPIHGTFRVLEDEVGMHGCPRCPEEPATDREEEET